MVKSVKISHAGEEGPPPDCLTDGRVLSEECAPKRQSSSGKV